MSALMLPFGISYIATNPTEGIVLWGTTTQQRSVIALRLAALQPPQPIRLGCQ